jgi:plastocyanin
MRKALVAMLMAALVLAGCNGNGDLETEAEDGETPAECSDVSSSEGAPAPLTMKDNFFEPLCLVVSSTQEITLDNAGNTLHNFSIEDQGVDIDVESGSETSTGPMEDLVRPGTFRFICKYHEAEGMVGTLTVE